MEGTCKWFNTKKGFGFITDNEGRDYFVHMNDLIGRDELSEQDSVTFESETSPKGPKATQVKKVG